MLIDIHTHLDDAFYDENCYRVINAIDPDDYETIHAESSKENSKIIPAYGVHPWYADKINKELLEKYIVENPDAYVGETGLDYGKRSCAGQEDVFLFHIELANKYDRPLMIHCYNASHQMYEIIKNRIKVPFLMHRYSDDINLLPKFIELGAYFSYGMGAPVDKIEETPLDRILSETDAKTFTVSRSVGYIADVLKKDAENMKEIIWKNAKTFLTKSNLNG